MFTNMINLPNLKIIDMKESEYDYRFLVESIDLSPSHCPKCGIVANLYKHGKKQQLYFDLPMHAKRVGIYVNRQRYKCKECNETFFENLPDMNVNRSVTNRLINWIQEASLEKTFTSVAEEIGVDEKTVRNIFNDYVAELEAETEFRTPRWLGLDEVHLLKNYRFVVTDVENRAVIDILRKRNKSVVIDYLSKLQGIDKVELVAMDMWRPYKDAVNIVIPHAKIVIDKFHVVKLANEALEKIRKANREKVSAKERRQLMRDRYVLLTRRRDLNDFDDQIKLQVWTDKFPLLAQAYELKEQFFDIYEAKSADEAYIFYQDWLASVPEELVTYFADLIKAMSNWEEEIFNYFTFPITNAYTESLNRLIKTMNHIGRGYSFEALRAKILFTQGYRKVKRKKKFKEVEATFGKMLPDQMPNWLKPDYEWEYEEIYGADFSTLFSDYPFFYSKL